MSTYPIPGTNAARIADYIAENPQCTRYAIAKAMDLNEATVNRAVAGLARNKEIFAQTNDKGHLCYTHIDQIDD